MLGRIELIAYERSTSSDHSGPLVQNKCNYSGLFSFWLLVHLQDLFLKQDFNRFIPMWDVSLPKHRGCNIRILRMIAIMQRKQEIIPFFMSILLVNVKAVSQSVLDLWPGSNLDSKLIWWIGFNETGLQVSSRKERDPGLPCKLLRFILHCAGGQNGCRLFQYFTRNVCWILYIDKRYQLYFFVFARTPSRLRQNSVSKTPLYKHEITHPSHPHSLYSAIRKFTNW